ncbi:MAG: HU family DNA-binding protein, partial [Rikenellaceae bacterium]|nr:HU family DNA-binding protein [Rikenellaceae bacterium]
RVQTVTKKQLAKIMSRGSTFSVGECEGLITDIAEFVTDQLLQGNAVRLDGLGTLKLKVSGKAREKKEDVTSAGATIRVVFEPDADMEQRLNTEKTFQFVEKATADGEQDTTDPQTDPNTNTGEGGNTGGGSDDDDLEG